MPNPQLPFESEYAQSSQTTSRSEGAISRAPAVAGAPPISQTPTVSTGILPPLEQLIHFQKYGSGKPRRVIIRASISHE
jgi:hypothetical protein